jgi:hypothetical protein
VSIYVQARRIADRPLFAELPYQSDYRTKWTAASTSRQLELQGEAGGTANGHDFSYLSGWQALRRSLLQRRKNSLRNRKWFKPLAP